MSLAPGKGELLMALAEYVRNDVSLDVDVRREVREVVGFNEDTEVRNPNCSCRWVVITVVVYYETWDGELAHVEIEKNMADLITELEETVLRYGQHTQYSDIYNQDVR